MYIWDRKSLINSLKDEILYIDDKQGFDINYVMFDSGKCKKNSLFIAKKGEKNDGHKFIKDVIEKGGYAIAEYVFDEELKNNPRIIIVKNTMQAMEKMTVYRRNELKGKVIGITGSLGKTSTKDLTYNILNNFGKASCNIQSFNNYIGVMTTMLNTPKDAEYAIFEIGMSEAGELRPLAKLVKPDISIITNIEPAHLGCFNNIDEIAFEKSEILAETNELAILNIDNRFFNFLKDKAYKNNLKVFSFGKSEKADIRLTKSEIVEGKIEAEYNIFGKTLNVLFNILDINIVFNSLPVLGIIKYLNLSFENVANYLFYQECSRGRNNLERITYEHKGHLINLNIINGTYNAVNPKAFNSGFELIKNFKNSNKKICIFGPIKEAGEKTEEFHLSLKDKILDSNIDIVLLFSEEMKTLYNALKDNPKLELHYFNNYEEIIENIDNFIEDNDIIFIKSSKYSKTYKIFNYLNKNNPMDLFM